jgi:hypothetical protein
MNNSVQKSMHFMCFCFTNINFKALSMRRKNITQKVKFLIDDLLAFHQIFWILTTNHHYKLCIVKVLGALIAKAFFILISALTYDKNC